MAEVNEKQKKHLIHLSDKENSDSFPIILASFTHSNQVTTIHHYSVIICLKTISQEKKKSQPNIRIPSIDKCRFHKILILPNQWNHHRYLIYNVFYIFLKGNARKFPFRVECNLNKKMVKFIFKGKFTKKNKH